MGENLGLLQKSFNEKFKYEIEIEAIFMFQTASAQFIAADDLEIPEFPSIFALLRGEARHGPTRILF